MCRVHHLPKTCNIFYTREGEHFLLLSSHLASANCCSLLCPLSQCPHPLSGVMRPHSHTRHAPALTTLESKTFSGSILHEMYFQNVLLLCNLNVMTRNVIVHGCLQVHRMIHFSWTLDHHDWWPEYWTLQQPASARRERVPVRQIPISSFHQIFIASENCNSGITWNHWIGSYCQAPVPKPQNPKGDWGWH